MTLVGTVLTQASSRAGLEWEFIVLDTDGVNAFAAPGGIVHITRGALGLIKSEAELAAVLGHEIAHIAEKHTVKAIEKSNRLKAVTDAAAGSKQWISDLAGATYVNIVENGFDRADESEADTIGLRLANTAGYNPAALSTFLTKLMERNKTKADRNGLFASHPETQSRLDRIAKQVKTEKLGSTAMTAGRYTSTVPFDAKPLTSITQVAPGTKGITGGPAEKAEKAEKKEEPRKKGFGLGGVKLTEGKQVEGTQASASAGRRAIGEEDRHAAGGDNPNKLTVTVTAAEIATFKQGIV